MSDLNNQSMTSFEAEKYHCPFYDRYCLTGRCISWQLNPPYMWNGWHNELTKRWNAVRLMTKKRKRFFFFGPMIDVPLNGDEIWEERNRIDYELLSQAPMMSSLVPTGRCSACRK